MNFQKILKAILIGLPIIMTLITIVMFFMYLITLSWDWGIRVFISFIACMASCATSINLWDSLVEWVKNECKY